MNAFARLAHALSKRLDDGYGDLPRQSVNGRIYRPTEYPAEHAILFHNESAHLPAWPRKMFFYCQQPAASGGATRLSDARRVAQTLSPSTFERLEKRGIRYVRRFRRHLDTPWETVFGTSSREEVERHWDASGMQHQWRSDGGVSVSYRAQPIRRHPSTGETVLFSQLPLFHPAFLEPELRSALQSLFGTDPPRDVCFGDGSDIDDDTALEIGAAYERCAVDIDWQRGDILVVDNLLKAHARAPYTGERRIAIAMGDPTQARTR